MSIPTSQQPSEQERQELAAEFEAAARRTLEQRLRYAFIHTYKPVLDDAPYRSFESMEAYRQWCQQNLPAWLGYGSSEPVADTETQHWQTTQ